MSFLFDPITFRGLTLRNRIAVSPMCQYSCQDGMANDWHLVHLGSRAVGGAALVFTEAAAITPEGRISPADLGLWKDEQIEPLGRAFRFIMQQGVAPGIQLAHAGRKASTAAPWLGNNPLSPQQSGWAPIFAPSPVPFAPSYQTPCQLSETQIAGVIVAFAAAASRAHAAGAKVIEIHAAHGYLLHEFLSPLTNQRTDSYGGSFSNRTRMVREVVTSIRERWPEELPLMLRISATDWTEGGWTIEDSVELARMIKPMGVDLIDCSSGGAIPDAKIPVGPGYQVPFAEKIRRDAGIATGAVGMITSPEQADQIIRTGQADLVLLARELLREPYWPLLAAHALGHDVEWPLQYLRAKPR
jgi:2,4-dienoyl-CoA reductase-like NADH-dependent reductase (Old Yellow Enzyme family)